MRPNLPYLAWGLRRLIAGRTADLRAAAARSRTLCPAERATVPPAIRAEGAFDRVTGLSPWRNRAVERLLAEGGRIEHAATEAHLVEGVTLSGPALYRGAARARPGFGRERFVVPPGPARRIDEAHLVTDRAGAHFFGSHLRDAYPLALLPPPEALALALPTKPYEHDAGYRALFGLPSPAVVATARIGRLILYTDFAQNRSKAERYRALRDRLRAAAPPASSPPAVSPRGVYLKRGPDGEPRRVVDEPALEAKLRALGFEIVEPAGRPAEDVVRRMLGAPVIVAVEGSHVSHALYTIAEGGALLVLQPPDRFSMVHKEPADALGLRFAFIVGRPAEGGFSIDPDEVERMIGRLM